MPDTTEILKIRTLLYFHDSDSVNCGASRIARAFGLEKYQLTRTMARLEKEGLLIRNGRNPALTEKGKEQAAYFGERVQIIMNHFMYEGVDEKTAYADAISLSSCMSERTMEVFRAAEERCRVKYELRDKFHFSGEELCKRLKDGEYHFPFLIYRENIKGGTNLSMANEGFEHPCTLSIQDGVGKIYLKIRDISAKSGLDGQMMSGRVKNLRYLQGRYIKAETTGKIIAIPASSLKFVNIGADMGQILHGSVCIKLECTVGIPHMPESTAIFTILI